MPLVDVEQGTAEWLVMRIGCVTASRMNDVMAKLKTKDKEAQVRKDYKAAIVCEMLTGRAQDNYVSPAMEWGLDNEIFARNAYEVEVSPTEPGGFALHASIPRFGASPDGLVGDFGLVEFKCPTTAVHLDYIANGIVPEEYHWQMFAQMSCAERSWCDFVSFDPRLPKKFQLFIRRLDRDDARIAEMEAEVMKFLQECVDAVKLLEKSKMVELPSAEIADAENPSVRDA